MVLYNPQTISGYNAAPVPTDDGSQTEANRITWAKHLSKIGGPLKTLAEAINTELTAAFARVFPAGVSAVAATYVHLTTDQNKLLTVASGSGTHTLVAAATAGSGFMVGVKNNGSGTVTLDGNASETIDGATTKALAGAGAAMLLICDGSNWHTFGASVALGAANVFTAEQTIQLSDDGAGIGPGLVLDRLSASPAISDILGFLRLDGRNASAATVNYARIFGKIAATTAGAHGGEIWFETAQSGALAAQLIIANGLATNGLTAQGSGSFNAATFWQSNKPFEGAKFWADLDGVGTATLDDSFNIASITDNGTGDYTFTIAVDMASANYAVVGMAQHPGGTGAGIISLSTRAVGSVRVLATVENGTLTDTDPVMVAGFGD